MPDFNVDAVQALRSKLLKILTSSDTATGYYFSFAPGGFPQSDYTLQFLTDPTAIDQAFAFSYLANTVPMSTGDFSLSGTVIWDKYADWLNRYTPPPFSLTPDEQAKLAGAEAYIDANYMDYVKYQSAWQNTYFDWQTLVVMPKADRPSNYATLLAKAKAAMDTAKKTWDVLGHRSTFETNYATVQDLCERDPVVTKQRLKDKLGSPLNAPGGDYYQTILTPANLLDPAFKWPHFTFFQDETHQYSQDNTRAWGGNISVGSLLWSASAGTDGRQEYHEKQTDTMSMSMEFDLLRAPIIRPWFSTYLLFSQGWKWANSTKDNPTGGDPFSDGNLPASGNWQMIPTEAIFVRNLKVKIDMQSEANKESLLETHSAFEGGWGPFKIKGSVDTKDGKKQYDFKEQKDGFTCEQPQIIGFFCALMPKEPNPNWSLWQE